MNKRRVNGSILHTSLYIKCGMNENDYIRRTCIFAHLWTNKMRVNNIFVRINYKSCDGISSTRVCVCAKQTFNENLIYAHCGLLKEHHLFAYASVCVCFFHLTLTWEMCMGITSCIHIISLMLNPPFSLHLLVMFTHTNAH